MKALFLYFALLATAVAQPAFPTNIFLSVRVGAPPALYWHPNGETNPVTYTVFVGVEPRRLATNSGGEITIVNYNTSFDTTRTNLPASLFGTGVFYCSIIATYTNGLTSDPSAEARIVLPLPRPVVPTLLRTAEVRVYLDHADSLAGPWTEITNFPPSLLLVGGRTGFLRPRAAIAPGPTLLTP